jgi:hypothetical protein
MEDQDLTPALLVERLTPLIVKSYQSIFVGNNQGLTVPGIRQNQKPRASNVHAAPNSLNKIIK